jgi:hypothetical protein
VCSLKPQEVALLVQSFCPTELESRLLLVLFRATSVEAIAEAEAPAAAAKRRRGRGRRTAIDGFGLRPKRLALLRRKVIGLSRWLAAVPGTGSRRLSLESRAPTRLQNG